MTAHIDARSQPGFLGDGIVASLAVVVAVGVAVAVHLGGTFLAALPVVLVASAGVVALALNRFEYFVLVGLAVRSSLDVFARRLPAGVEPAQVLGLGFLAAGAIWLAARWRVGAWVPLWTSTKLLVLFAAVAGVATAVAPDPIAGAVEWSRILAATMMLVVLNQLVPTAKLTNYIAVLFAAAAAPLTVGLAQLMMKHSLRSIGSLDRVNSTFLHPNPYAMFCTIVLIVGIAVYRHVDGGARRAVVLLSAAAALNLLFTYTRGAWVAALVGVVIISLRTNPRLVVGVALVTFAAYLVVPSVNDRVTEAQSTERVGVDANNSLTWRFEYWRESLSLAADNPVVGIGLKGVAATTAAAKQPHNDFVRTFVETGVIGFLAFTSFLAATVLELRRAVRIAPEGLPRAAAVGGLGSVAALVVFALSANVISQVVVLWYLVLVLAIGMAAARRTTVEPDVTTTG